MIIGRDSVLPVRKGRTGSRKFNSLTKHNLMETNELTPEKSFQIINEAIEKSRKDFEEGAGSPMTFWGTVVLVFSIIVWAMLQMTGNPYWNFFWFGIPVAGWPLFCIFIKGKCKKGGKSFISHRLGQIWLTYGIFATILATAFAFIAPQLTGFLTVSLLGFAAAVSGFILNNNYITAGGFITGIGCTIALFYAQNEFAPLCVALASILTLIVPGMMTNKRAK